MCKNVPISNFTMENKVGWVGLGLLLGWVGFLPPHVLDRKDLNIVFTASS